MQSLRSVVIFARWAGLLIVTLAMLPAPGLATHNGDVKVTDQTYTRHDGGADTAITRCGSDVSDSTPDGAPPAGDGTPEGGGNRQANEPAVAINPMDPDVIVAGANDYCGVATWGDAWMGFYVSTDGGANWMNSLNPGYPTDTSAEGMASPIFRRAFSAGDPIMDWDNDNRLFYGGISFNRTNPNESGIITPTNGDVIVSTWVRDSTKPLGMDYVRTVIVGEGTPSAFFFGRFNDKPSLKVDDWSASPHEGNVYVSWTLFPGAGSDQILFSRSTDNGETFSKPIKISMGVANAQGSDIAVAPNGDVYVVWRVFAHPAAKVSNAIAFVKSTDGGQTFSNPKTIASVPVPYDRSDRYTSGGGARDCGDGSFVCVSNFVFHRVASLPQAVVDNAGHIYVTWEQVVPGTPNNGDTYRPDGQARVVWTKSTNGGASWSLPASPVDPQSVGHQWWPNIEYDKSNNTLALIYYDSRADAQHSVNRPPGNKAGGTSTCGDPVGTMVCNVLNTFIATSTNGGSTWTSHQVSTTGHQPEYEMFGNRQVPFHGDYLWVDAVGGTIYGVWTDNRDVVPGVDIREASQDGFDVDQCRPTPTSADNCPNAGGLNQNIYGAKLP